MKFFHLSDLHIGLKLYNRDLREEQEFVFDQIVEAAERETPDAIVVAGDIYDKAVPSAEAIDTFDGFVHRLSDASPDTEIMMISGNHDSGPRINVFRSILKKHRIHMIGVPPIFESDRIERVVLRDDYGNVNFFLLPFVKPSMVKQITGTDENGNNLSYNEALHRLIAREEIDKSERNVLVTHQFYLPAGRDASDVERMDSEIRTIGNIDVVGADILHLFDYAALGHIHKPMKVGGEQYRYVGTPYPCSVSEAGQDKAILSVELFEKGRVEISQIPLKQKREVRVVKGALEEVLGAACDDFVSVVLTDKVDLDIIDMNDRIRSAFPYLLEIRRELISSMYSMENYTPEKKLLPYELCLSFLQDLDAQEEELLKDVYNSVVSGLDEAV